MNRGVLLALAAYLLWGGFPLYFMAVRAVPPVELLAHRVLFALLFVALLLTLQRRWDWLPPLLRQPRTIGVFGLSALMVSINWGAYIYAISQDRITDASLGYFINPLVSVVMGAVLLGERMRPLQWAGFALAAAGVAWLTWHAGQLPWIGLAVAISFSFYGLIRKTASLPSMEGLMLETALLCPIAIGYLAVVGAAGSAAYEHASLPFLLLIAASGPVTAMPLLLFAAAARRMPLSTLGIIQYLAPSVQFVLAITLFHEPFDTGRLLGFGAIWLGIVVFSGEAVVGAARRGLAAG